MERQKRRVHVGLRCTAARTGGMTQASSVGTVEVDRSVGSVVVSSSVSVNPRSTRNMARYAPALSDADPGGLRIQAVAVPVRCRLNAL